MADTLVLVSQDPITESACGLISLVTIGGNPGPDVFTSPGEPAFYAHHSGIDRMWWIWQMQDPAARVYGASAVGGPRTKAENSPNGTFHDTQWLGPYLAPGKEFNLGDLMNTVEGQFCYVYA